MQDFPILPTDQSHFVTLIRNGFIPASPERPNVAISIKALDYFHRCHLHCPQFSIQAFTRALADLHNVSFKTHYQEHMRVCYDIYLDLLDRTRQKVMDVLNRDYEDWRLENFCPCCTYELRGEAKLMFDILFTMDGNDSLKRLFVERTRARDADDENDKPEPCRWARLDLRDGRGTYIMQPSEVNQFSKDAIGEMLVTERADGEEENPCSDRWTNMQHELVSLTWKVFDETGWFLSVCRHGFVMIACDMIASGELVKYPLAVVNRLLTVLKKKLGGGYDIGCKFITTLMRSPVAPFAKKHAYKSFVGLFHGHAHCRSCQLKFLGTYVKGMGLEDLEGCERFFSRSNALAAVIRHQSRFHRHLEMRMYMQHMDRTVTYANLSKFLCNNYKQALSILAEHPLLDRAMRQLSVEDECIFEEWLEAEKLYLQNLVKEPEQETLDMEYLQALQSFYSLEKRVQDARRLWRSDTPSSFGTTPDNTRTIETGRRHLYEDYNETRNRVKDLEVRLKIAVRWVPDCEEWKKTSQLLVERTYRRRLDNLERLVVSRIFELTKMNISGSGYKLRKHIAKSLQVRSKTIRTALEAYNTAAIPLGRASLSWDQVVQYAFLADFDLLRDVREDMSQKPWATPKGRGALDRYFKLNRAREEITRLDIEIRRLVTKDLILRQREASLASTSPALAHQVALYRIERGRFDHLHLDRFTRLVQKYHVIPPTILVPGEAVHDAPDRSGTAGPRDTGSSVPDEDSDAETDIEEEEEELSNITEALARVDM
ncbi:hypothetical protein BDZ89DRAFT_955942 [Hymenopellis radicata]|nr:hypothetical protein BDZ89DRAFT_955942 [Hymenopellis radicata]